MRSLRQLIGLPRFPLRVYVLTLGLFLVLAYLLTGPVYHFLAKLPSALGSFYEPKDHERGEFLKHLETNEQEKR